MNFQDTSIRCYNCGAVFTISAEKQEFYNSWGLTNQLKCCPACLRTSQSEPFGSGNNRRDNREMFRITCAKCGKNTEVPFKPRTGGRVYCRDCYDKVKIHR